MNARPPLWIGPGGVLALLVLALLAGAFTIVVGPISAIIVTAALALALFGLDAAALARAPEIARTIPAPLMLARRTAFVYTLRSRGTVALRFAIYEAPIARLEVAIAPARGRLGPGATVRAPIEVFPRERGRTQSGIAFATIQTPLGLVQRRLRIGEIVELRVRPDLSAIDRGGDIAQRSRLIELGLRRVRRRGTGTEFESLREYAGGDPFRAIDWKATARRGKVMVAQHDVERSQQIVLAIDAGRLMSPRLGDRRKLDYAVSAALAVATLARSAADRVGLHAFAGTTLMSIPAQAGAGQSALLTDALSDLEPRFEESDYERAALALRRGYGKRSLITVFTDLFDPIASGAVLASLRLLTPHHLVLVVLMNDAAISDAYEREPTTVAEAYRAGVATTLAAERARAVSVLRGRGIGVIDVPARDLTLALLDAYIDVKTRSLL